MRRIFFVAVVVAAALAMGMGVGTIAAQKNATDNEIEAINASEIAQTIDSETAITNWEFEDGQFEVTFYAERETTVTVAESGMFSEGSGDFAYYSREIPAGESVETFRVLESEGAALTIATPLAQAEERGAYISTGPAVEETAEENPFQTFGGESGLFFGIFMSVGLAVVGTVHVLRSEESGVIEA